jgi:hypothetical protein
MFQKKLKAKTELLLSQQRFRTTTRTNNMIKTARTMTCSICHDTGHNKRSCIRRNCRDIIEDIVSSAVQIADEKKMDEFGKCEDCNRVLYESVHIFCYAHKDNEDMTLCHQCGEDWDHKAEGWTRDDDDDEDESEEEESEEEDENDDDEIAFHCAQCNKAIICNSEEHDECWTMDDEDWFCGECKQYFSECEDCQNAMRIDALNTFENKHYCDDCLTPEMVAKMNSEEESEAVAAPAPYTKEQQKSAALMSAEDALRRLEGIQWLQPKAPEQSPEEINAHLREFIQKQRKKLDDMEEEMAEKDAEIARLTLALISSDEIQTALGNAVRAARDEQEAKEEKRMDEFMEWQMDLFKQYEAKQITHAQGMRMMKELYPEFTPDDKEGEDSFTEKDAELKVVREIVQCKRPNAELEFGEDGSALRFIFADGRMQIYKITPDVLQEIGEERLDAYFEYDAREGSTGTLSNRWAEFHPLSVRDVMNQEHYRGK